MPNAKSLLDQLLGQVNLSAITGSGQNQPASAQGQDEGQAQGGTAGRGLGGPLGGALGGINLEGLLSGRGGLATGAAAGGLVGLLLGGSGGRKLAGGALKVGGAALIGGLAYKAWQDYQAGRAPGATPASNPPPISGAPAGSAAPLPIEDASGTAFMPADEHEQEALSRSLIAAMIGAAKADGHVTDEERQRIAMALAKLNIEGDQRAVIEAELAKPLDVGAIASMATSMEHKVEIYAASLIAVNPDGTAEKGYLAMLAARLGLDQRLVEHLHANADQLLTTK